MMEHGNATIVTGAGGFVGAAVVQALASAGLPVIAVARSAVMPSHALVEPIRVDRYKALRDRPELLARTRTILHFADRADRKAYDESNRGDAAALVAALADACAQHHVPRLIVASSIYADRPERSAYGWSKHAAEHALALATPAPGVAIALRLPPVHGLGSHGMFASLARHVAAGHPLPLGLAMRPRRFLGIANLCDLARHIAGADGESLTSGVYAPADPEPMSLKDVTQAIGLATGCRPRLIPVPFIDRLSPATIIDPAAALRHRAELQHDLGWRAPWRTDEQLAYLS
jgi:nucleoside-diphosphate-sugar epimerase